MADLKVTQLSDLGAAPASNDLFMVVDVSDTTMSAAGTNKKVTGQYVSSMAGSVLYSGASALSAASIAATDELWIWDVSEGTLKKTTRAELVGGVVTEFTADISMKVAKIINFYRSDNVRYGSIFYDANGLNIKQGASDDLYFLNNAGTALAVLNASGAFKIVNLAGTGNRAVYSDANGTLTNSSSDASMKTAITEIDSSEALALIDELRAVRYNWQEELQERLGAQREIGLIAQEVQPHVPEVVGANADGTLSIDYAKLTTLLIAGIQELSARVTGLEAAVLDLMTGGA